MAEKSEFELWIEAAELHKDTVQVLADNGFLSLKSVSKLTQPLIQKYFAKAIPLGQLLLLESAIDELKKEVCVPAIEQTGPVTPPAAAPVNNDRPMPAHDPSTSSEKTLPEEGIDFTKLCQMLGHGADTSNGQTQAQAASHTTYSGKTQLFDPFQWASSKVFPPTHEYSYTFP